MTGIDIDKVHRPWKGDLYDSQVIKLLLLGKAHYSHADASNYTEWVVSGVMERGAHEPFFTKTAALLARAGFSDSSRPQDVWHRVAFMNYIPLIVGQGVHDRPSEDLWASAKPRFLAALDELEPTHVMSLGKEQWNRLRPLTGWESTALHDGPLGAIRLWRKEGHQIVATPINHPSASHGFSVDRWADHVREFLSSRAPA